MTDNNLTHGVNNNFVTGDSPGLRKWHSMTKEQQMQRKQELQRFRRKIWEEHVFDGKNYNTLAKENNLPVQRIRFYLDGWAKKQSRREILDIPAERYEQYNKLKSLMQAVWERAMTGDDDAIKSYVSLSARVSKVIGLDAPVKMQHQVNSKHTHQHTHVVDMTQLEERFALLQSRLAQRGELERQKLVATRGSEPETLELTPVSNQSDQKQALFVAISGTKASTVLSKQALCAPGSTTLPPGAVTLNEPALDTEPSEEELAVFNEMIEDRKSSQERVMRAREAQTDIEVNKNDFVIVPDPEDIPNDEV